MRLIALDFGTKKCGVAISDPLKIISSPLKTIFYEGKKEILIDEISKILDEYKPIESIILGFPKNIDGSLSPTSNLILKFKSYLETKINIPIVLFDEKYTTKASLNVMREMGISNKNKKEIKDAIAAQKILENYLNMNK